MIEALLQMESNFGDCRRERAGRSPCAAWPVGSPTWRPAATDGNTAASGTCSSEGEDRWSENRVGAAACTVAWHHAE